MKAQIGLQTEAQNKLAQILNTVLADEHVVYTKLRNYHWNVKGREFVSLHELFEQQYNTVKLLADEIAERVQMIGGHAIGRMDEFLAHTRLEEAPSDDMSAEEMVKNLLHTNEAMVRNLRADIDAAADDYNDEGTADQLTETMKAHEEMAWMLRSLLE